MADSNMNALGSYQDLTQDAGFVELHNWNFVRLTGRDRHQLLHNFCTANVKQLPAGHCTEAFILNEKGKSLWFGQIIALDDQLLLCGASAFGDRIQAHLSRYVIREDVQVIDCSSELRAAFVSGAKATARLNLGLGVSLPDANQSIRTETSFGRMVVANLEVANRGYLLIHAASPGLVTDWLANLSISKCDQESLDILRMENVTPWYGIDVDESNLPQEVNRDAKAISFTKGCYLGQETVARLDALGHVNQLLVGLKFETNTPPLSGQVIEQAGKKVLRVTSTAKSDTGTIGMGYVRRELAVSGSKIAYQDGVIQVA